MELNYPTISRIEGVGPMQYGTKGLLGPNFTDIEEKYDLTEAQDGFGEEGEEGLASDDDSEEEDDAGDEDASDDDAGGMFDDSSEAY
jgi:hypothetical protein